MNAHEPRQGDSSTKPQLTKWVEKKEKHEQVAVGEKAPRSKKKTKRWIEGMERKVDGKGA